MNQYLFCLIVRRSSPCMECVTRGRLLAGCVSPGSASSWPPHWRPWSAAISSVNKKPYFPFKSFSLFKVLEFNERPLSVSLSIQTNGQSINLNIHFKKNFPLPPLSESLTLPDIIMCPFNRFNRTFFQQLNISDGLAQYIEVGF